MASSGVKGRLMCELRSRPCSLATTSAPADAGAPDTVATPADCTRTCVQPRCSSACCATAAANGLRQVLPEPVGRHGGDLFERAGLLEEMGRARHGPEPFRAGERGKRLPVQPEDLPVVGAHDQQRWRADRGEAGPREVRAPAARNHRRDTIPELVHAIEIHRAVEKAKEDLRREFVANIDRMALERAIAEAKVALIEAKGALEHSQRAVKTSHRRWMTIVLILGAFGISAAMQWVYATENRARLQRLERTADR